MPNILDRYASLNQAIYDLFRSQGETPLTRTSLCSTFNLDDRAVRQAILEVIRIYRLPIIPAKGSSGYHVATTAEEMDEAISSLMSYFLSLNERIELLKELKVEILGQTKLDFQTRLREVRAGLEKSENKA